jgi:hypothetical protein
MMQPVQRLLQRPRLQAHRVQQRHLRVLLLLARHSRDSTPFPVPVGQITMCASQDRLIYRY